jgi:hypothetical protein
MKGGKPTRHKLTENNNGVRIKEYGYVSLLQQGLYLGFRRNLFKHSLFLGITTLAT